MMTKHTPTSYEITRQGRVFSLSSNWRGYGRREMVQRPNEDGYLYVRLTVTGSRRVFLVHKLVAAEFLPPRPSKGHEIRHLDGDRKHNADGNLAWGTRKQNADDRERHGRTSRGEKHSAAIRASNQAEGTRAFRQHMKDSPHV
jgi:hypothetical protein